MLNTYLEKQKKYFAAENSQKSKLTAEIEVQKIGK